VHVPSSSLHVSLPSRFTSCLNTLLTSRNVGLNALFIFIPLAWVSHFEEWTHGLTFARMSYPLSSLFEFTNHFLVCFLAIIALEKMFDWGGEQLAMYCGPDLGDLIIITLNKYVRLIGARSVHAESSFLAPSKPLSRSFFLFDASKCPYQFTYLHAICRN
jgi:hypothetical protein